MKKKIALLSTTMLLSMAALTGCGKDNRKAISMWATFNTNYQAIIEKAIKNFEEQNPEWRIDYVKQNGSYDDLKDMVVKGVPAGNYPDLVVAYPDSVADFLYTGKALNIEPYMKNAEYGWTEEDFADIPEGYIVEGQSYMIPGTYSLPICKSTEAMYYNKAIIGVDLSDYDADINDGNPIDEDYLNSLTWDELFDHLCPAIIQWNDEQPDDQKIINTNTVAAAEWKDDWAVVGYDSDDNLFITLAEQYGYGYTSIDETTGSGKIEFVNDGMKGLMKKFNEAHSKHYFTTKGVVGKNVNYLSTVGAMIFSIGSTGGVGYQFSAQYPKDVGIARIPQKSFENEEDIKIINQGPSIAFMKRDVDTIEYAEHAWKFYKCLTEKQITTEWATTTGYTPIRKSVAETAAYMDYSNESKYELKTASRLTARNAKYATSVLDYLFVSPVFLGSSKARKAVGNLAGEVIGKAGLTDADLNTSFQNAYNNAI